METVESAREIPKLVVRKRINASRERIFDAWTKPELMEKWFYPGEGRAISSNNLKVGGKWAHEMIYDKFIPGCAKEAPAVVSENGQCRYPHTGEYLEIKPPERLVFTWNSPVVKNTRVTVELRDVGGATDVIITHELLDTEELRLTHTSGWDGALSNLETFLE